MPRVSQTDTSRVSGPTIARRFALVGVALALVLCTPEALEAKRPKPTKPNASRVYRAQYHVIIKPGRKWAEVTLTLKQESHLLREARFSIDRRRFNRFEGDGVVATSSKHTVWKVPPKGGTLRYRARIPHQRKLGTFDAYITKNWALFRGEDLFPAVATRGKRGARSTTTLTLDLPDGWSAATPYRKISRGTDTTYDTYAIDNPQRKFDRPTGWLLVGDIGVNRETVAGVKVSVAAPKKVGMERVSILALLRFSLPQLDELGASLPDRLNIVGAPDPMWRGGLSGPKSMFLHTDRPLFSANGTSTLMHELMHMFYRVRTVTDEDWIDEGLAEYMGLLVLLRAGALSKKRFRRALKRFGERGRNVKNLRTKSAKGPITARAVTIFRALDREIRRHSKGKATIFTLAAALSRAKGSRTGNKSLIDIAALRKTVRDITGQQSEVLARSKLPGYR